MMEGCDKENERKQQELRSNFDKALQTLIQMTGIPRERGERLLHSTLCESCDVQSWIEEAMVEIAIENEVNEECRELSLAMEASLNEASTMKKSEKKVVLLPMAEILEIFPASSLLRICDSFWGVIESDFELKSLVVQFMKLEDRCKKWWAQSEAYFEEKSLWFCSTASPLDGRDTSSSIWKRQISEYLENEISNIEREAFAFPAEESGGREFTPNIFKRFSIPQSSVISLLQDSD